MKHYEIIILIHPDRSEQIEPIIARYKGMIEEGSGVIHRLEDWGRRPMAYPIKELHKAHCVLMNIACDSATHRQLEHALRSNHDVVIRYMIRRRDWAITEPSLVSLARTDARDQRVGSDAVLEENS